ncbi:MAG: hybrid sensor histidine kinase/response regulator [Thermaurantimonas sp.]
MDSMLFKEIVDKSEIPTLIHNGSAIVYANQSFYTLINQLKVDEEKFYSSYLTDSSDQSIHITKNDKNIYLNVIKQQLERNHAVYQLIDVTEEQVHLLNLENTIASLNEIDRQRNHFLENLSHELRTPLTGIIGFTDLLKYTELSQEAQLYIDSLSQSANRMVDTLNNINDFSLIISDKIIVQNEEVDIYSLLKNACDSFYYKAKSKNLTIHLSGEIAPKVHFFCDGKKLDKIIKQLLSNAIKFTDSGKIDVYYRTDSEKCIISVSDTGIGIEPDRIDECFDDFRQLSEGYNRHYEGSGIGLSIVKKLVHIMDGKIEVNSKPNQGSTFTITIPNSESSDRQITDIKNITKKNRKSILYVEDNYLNQKLLEICLGKKYHITLADNAEQGLSLLGKKEFDLVLMDINLGKGMDGIQAMKEIKKNNQYNHLPVIALTAYALANDEEKFLNEGFDDYIPKPYTKEVILNKISKYLPI